MQQSLAAYSACAVLAAAYSTVQSCTFRYTVCGKISISTQSIKRRIDQKVYILNYSNNIPHFAE